MEKNSPSDQVRYIDVLSELPDLAAFRQSITHAETLAYADIDTDTAEENIGRALEELDTTLGVGGQGEPAYFSGYAFRLNIDENGETDEQINPDAQTLLFDQLLTFKGLDYYEINGETRVLFSLQDTQSKPERAYATPLDAILRLEIMDPTSRKYLIKMFLKEQSEQALKFTSSADFLSAEKDMQYEWLRQVAIACYEELTPLIDESHSAVECTTFYTHIDNDHESTFTITKTDQTKLEFEGRKAVTGTVIGVIFLEVLQRALPYRNQEDFIYGGTPCVTIRDESAGKTVYIPIANIEDIRSDD